MTIVIVALSRPCQLPLVMLIQCFNT